MVIGLPCCCQPRPAVEEAKAASYTVRLTLFKGFVAGATADGSNVSSLVRAGFQSDLFQTQIITRRWASTGRVETARYDTDWRNGGGKAESSDNGELGSLAEFNGNPSYTVPAPDHAVATYPSGATVDYQLSAPVYLFGSDVIGWHQAQFDAFFPSELCHLPIELSCFDFGTKNYKRFIWDFASAGAPVTPFPGAPERGNIVNILPQRAANNSPILGTYPWDGTFEFGNFYSILRDFDYGRGYRPGPLAYDIIGAAPLFDGGPGYDPAAAEFIVPPQGVVFLPGSLAFSTVVFSLIFVKTVRAFPDGMNCNLADPQARDLVLFSQNHFTPARISYSKQAANLRLSPGIYTFDGRIMRIVSGSKLAPEQALAGIDSGATLGLQARRSGLINYDPTQPYSIPNYCPP